MDLSNIMNSHIVVDGLPDVAPEKKPIFMKLFSKKVGDTVGKPPVNIHLVDDEKTKNYVAAFIEFSSPAEADAAISKLHGLAFTKTVKFTAYRWSDFDKAENTPDKLDDAEDGADEGPRDMTDNFLLDEQARPQMLLKSGPEYDCTWSYLNTKQHSLDLIRTTANNFEKAPWCELDKLNRKLQRPTGNKKPFPQWSPRGTYLISQHRDVLKFFGGASMQLCAEVTFASGDLQDLVISSTERFCIVKSRGLHFWNLTEGRLIRSIVRADTGASADSGANEDDNATYQYNADDTMVGALTTTATKQGLSIYDAATMKLISDEEGTRFTAEIPGLKAFSFSPTNPNMLAYALDNGNNTWRIHVENLRIKDERVPSFQNLCRRQWTNITAINLLWHPSGDFLCARLTKIQGDRQYVDYCIFRTATNNVSAELFDPKGEARRFVWQPSCNRFALLVVPSGQKALIARQHLQFYSIEPRVGIKLVGKTMENDADRVIFAPRGSRCVAVNVDKSVIEFFGVLGSGPFPPTGSQEMVQIAERNTDGSPNKHSMPTDFDWDPTGRYFVSITSGLKYDVDNLITIWNANGRVVFQEKKQRLSHASFRPLPPTLLTHDELTKIRQQLPKKSQEYELELAEAQKKVDAVAREKYDRMEANYRKILEGVASWAEEEDFAATRQKLKESAPMYKFLMKKAEETD